MEEFPSDMPPMDGYNPEGGGVKGVFKSKWFWIVIVAVIAIVGGVVFYRKKKEQRKWPSMSSIDLFRIGLKNLWKRKVGPFLQS